MSDERGVGGPLQEDTMRNDEPTHTCPFLGLAEDRSLKWSEPSQTHRCYAQTPPAVVLEDRQDSHCLAPAHVRCSFYSVDKLAKLDRIDTQVSPSSTRQQRRGAWLLLGATIFFVAIVFLLVSNMARKAFDPLFGGTALADKIPMALELDNQGDDTNVGGGNPIVASAPVTAGETLEGDPTEMEVTSEATVKRSLLPTPTPNPTTAQAAASESGTANRIVTPPPSEGGETFTLRPGRSDVGWWRSDDPRRNYIGDSFLYAGNRENQTYVSSIRFDLSSVPRGAVIEEAELQLTGLRKDQVNDQGEGTWLVQLVPDSSIEELTELDFLTLFSAPASLVLTPPLAPEDLEERRTNRWNLDDNVRNWLEQQLLNGATSVYIRIQAAVEYDNESLFAWDSGWGSESQGSPPQLVLNVGPAPPTPPPLPTKPVIVATPTDVPENVVTVVALANTATFVAETTGTYTPPPYDIVTPTPVPANLATVQAVALARDLPPVALNTPTPASAAMETANAEYATAVAVTTGTFTPVPTNYVTPVLILPSPPAENVATEAARVAQATTIAANGADSGTPLPYNAVLAEYVYATPVPENAATAAAELVIAAARDQVDGTATPLPWNAVIITAVPSPPPPTPTPLPVILEPTPTIPPETPTPLPEGLPADLYGKIIFLSDRTGAEQPHLLDPATGEVRLITQRWVYDRARDQLSLSPDGQALAIVEGDISRPNEGGGHVLQIKVHSNQYNTSEQITACSSDCYDSAWSPGGEWIAYVGQNQNDEEIFISSPDGSTTRQLTANDWESDKHPTWSPDGTQIVFFSNRTGKNQLWIMNSDGSDQKNLSSNEYNDSHPIWIRSP